MTLVISTIRSSGCDEQSCWHPLAMVFSMTSGLAKQLDPYRCGCGQWDPVSPVDFPWSNLLLSIFSSQHMPTFEQASTSIRRSPKMGPMNKVNGPKGPFFQRNQGSRYHLKGNQRSLQPMPIFRQEMAPKLGYNQDYGLA